MKIFTCCKGNTNDNNITVRVDCNCFTRPKVYKIELQDDQDAEIIGKKLHTMLNKLTEDILRYEIQKHSMDSKKLKDNETFHDAVES